MTDDLRRFFVVGMGPGSRAYLTPEAIRTIGEADVLIGGDRHLDAYRETGKTLLPFSEVYPRLRESIVEQRKRGVVAVLVSGDPGYYSLLQRIAGLFDPDEFMVIPGVSSMQVACARVGMSWQDAVLASAHGRPISDFLNALVDGRPAVVLADRNNTPGEIARAALDAKISCSTVWVLENISYPDERITETVLSELPGKTFSDLSIVIMKRIRKETYGRQPSESD